MLISSSLMLNMNYCLSYLLIKVSFSSWFLLSHGFKWMKFYIDKFYMAFTSGLVRALVFDFLKIF